MTVKPQSYRFDFAAHDAYDGSYTAGLPDPISFLIDDGVLVPDLRLQEIADAPRCKHDNVYTHLQPTTNLLGEISFKWCEGAPELAALLDALTKENNVNESGPRSLEGHSLDLSPHSGVQSGSMEEPSQISTTPQGTSRPLPSQKTRTENITPWSRLHPKVTMTFGDIGLKELNLHTTITDILNLEKRGQICEPMNIVCARSPYCACPACEEKVD